MKGLLIKDFKLIKGQGSFFLMIAAFVAVAAILSDNPSFIIGYLTFLGSLFTLSTLSYDEFDNGSAFLFSLPITRKGYVTEKYGLGLLLSGGSWLLATLTAAAAELWKNSIPVEETITSASWMLPTVLFILSVMLPAQLKFGGEKSRVVIGILLGLAYTASFLISKIAGMLNIDLAAVADRLASMSITTLFTALLAAAVTIFLISLNISIAIINKKEF